MGGIEYHKWRITKLVVGVLFCPAAFQAIFHLTSERDPLEVKKAMD
jgi:hypothetical protein